MPKNCISIQTKLPDKSIMPQNSPIYLIFSPITYKILCGPNKMFDDSVFDILQLKLIVHFTCTYVCVCVCFSVHNKLINVGNV